MGVAGVPFAGFEGEVALTPPDLSGIAVQVKPDKKVDLRLADVLSTSGASPGHRSERTSLASPASKALAVIEHHPQGGALVDQSVTQEIRTAGKV